MARFTIRGRINSSGSRFEHSNVPTKDGDDTENGDDFHALWAWAKDNLEIRPDGSAGAIVMSESVQEAVEQCQPGDWVEQTVETRNSSDGNYLIIVDMRVIEPDESD